MKRIQSACLEQTIRFEFREDIVNFKADMDKKRTLYKIEDEHTEARWFYNC